MRAACTRGDHTRGGHTRGDTRRLHGTEHVAVTWRLRGGYVARLAPWNSRLRRTQLSILLWGTNLDEASVENRKVRQSCGGTVARSRGGQARLFATAGGRRGDNACGTAATRARSAAGHAAVTPRVVQVGESSMWDGWDGMGWNGMGRDETGRDGTGWDPRGLTASSKSLRASANVG